MEIVKHTWYTLKNIALIFNNETGSTAELFWTYLKLRIKYLVLVKILRMNIMREKIFGFEIHFFTYQIFLFMFEEIFISKEYQFTAKTERPLIFDCGSNVGTALIFFKRLYPHATILAFEPDKKTFDLLRKNVEINRFTDVRLYNNALFNREEVIDFYTDPENPGSLMMSTQKDRLPKERNAIQALPLSKFIDRPVDFIKMDIEGVESLVIDELSEKQKFGFIGEMCIEYHHHIKPDDDALSGMLKTLEKNGLRYQLCSYLKPPFKRDQFQDILIYAYRKQ